MDERFEKVFFLNNGCGFIEEISLEVLDSNDVGKKVLILSKEILFECVVSVENIFGVSSSLVFNVIIFGIFL